MVEALPAPLGSTSCPAVTRFEKSLELCEALSLIYRVLIAGNEGETVLHSCKVHSTMKFSLILAPLVLLSDVVSAQSSLTDICTGSANNGCKTTITVPNGFKIVKSSKNVRSIQFNYIKVNICDQIRKALGTTLGNKFLKARDPICNCFTKLRTLNSEGKFTSSSAGNFDLANNYYLDQAGTLEKVLLQGVALGFLCADRV